MCCGNRRAALTRTPTPPAARATHATPAVPASPARITTIVFEYTGTAPSATVIGPASGQRYRFNRPGDRLAVDARDRPGLMAVAGLRWVR
ncbi:MAG: hypothetical protein HY856_00700 [Burkholderiales bacterium]|nr:hypothetical protein [Burkholderiales bacterium]